MVNKVIFVLFRRSIAPRLRWTFQVLFCSKLQEAICAKYMFHKLQ